MATLVAFASLPFGLKGGDYEIKLPTGMVAAHVSELRFSPLLTITSRPELAQMIPSSGEGEGFTSYSWYDHPFVLRVLFGRNVASLGSINSYVSIVRPLPEALNLSDSAALEAEREEFGDLALMALNNLIAVVRHRAKLYHMFDLRRDDIDISVRREDGTVLHGDPLQDTLTRKEEQDTTTFDLVHESSDWYLELRALLLEPEPVSLSDNLMMEAERALLQRFPGQAIATCHTAIETAVSVLLTRRMSRRGVPDGEIDYVLSTKSLTAKMDVLLQTYAGFSLKRDNHALWNSFNRLNDLRNDAAHRGRRSSADDAQYAIDTARELLRWLEMVRVRNR
jgi:hypothetical protein